MRLLTPRARQILELRAEGLCAKQIASDLDIATSTVKNYLHSINCQLGARNIAHAMRIAFRVGLLK